MVTNLQVVTVSRCVSLCWRTSWTDTSSGLTDGASIVLLSRPHSDECLSPDKVLHLSTHSLHQSCTPLPPYISITSLACCVFIRLRGHTVWRSLDRHGPRGSVRTTRGHTNKCESLKRLKNYGFLSFVSFKRSRSQFVWDYFQRHTNTHFNTDTEMISPNIISFYHLHSLSKHQL